MTTISDANIDNNDAQDDELAQFEEGVNAMLETGELDDALTVTDENGVAQVLPVLDDEPVSHLLQGVEELGGAANVFVRTTEGIAVLTVSEYSPEHTDDDAEENADEDSADDSADADEVLDATELDDLEGND